VRACTTPLNKVAGRDVVTIEGLAQDGKLTALQRAFIDHGAFQCGFCTPGMLMAATAFLRQNPRPSRAEIMSHLERNLCRCGAHQRVVEAIESIAVQTGVAS